MRAVTMNVSLTPEQAGLVNGEVNAGNYASASELFREALRLWNERRIAKDVAEFDRLAEGTHERDTTADEEAAILRAQRKARAELRAGSRVRQGRAAKGKLVAA